MSGVQATITWGTFTASNVPLSEGLNTLSAVVTDLGGNSATASVPVILDTIPPVITNVIPADGSRVTGARPGITALHSDAASGINTNSVILKLDGADVTAQATVTESQVNFTPLQALSDGVHNVEFKVSDRAGNPSNVQTNFTVSTLSTSGPPVLSPIGDRSVDLGTRLTLSLNASDPDGDALAFSVSPLPLPENASLNAVSGVFTFTPILEQVGSFQLPFLRTVQKFTIRLQ